MSKLSMYHYLKEPLVRPSSHAGSWYDDSAERLEADFARWFAQSTPDPKLPKSVPSTTILGDKGTQRFGVGPHAGYAYCGQVLAQTYAALARKSTIFIMGPSHYKYFKGVRTTQFTGGYETPLGIVPVDTSVLRTLEDNKIRTLQLDDDIEEHSIEMHCPILKARFPEARIVPLVFGHMTSNDTRQLVEILLPYFKDESVGFVVSSDFCHWGRRFDYTSVLCGDGKLLLRPSNSGSYGAIWEGIQNLDFKAMEVASKGSSSDWENYISITRNTVCGHAPLEFLLALGEAAHHQVKFQWIAYEQSSRVKTEVQSSVSYASGVAS